MKIANFGDLHGHMFKEFDEPSDRTGSKRLDIIVDAIRYMGKYCIENDIKYLLFSGDLYHTRGKVNTVVLNAIYDEIKSLGEQGIIVVMIAGNHDQYDNSDIPENSLHQFRGLTNIYVHDTLGVQCIGDGEDLVFLQCVPYTKDTDRVKEYLSMLTDSSDIPKILLMHAGVSGAVVGQDNYPLMDAFTVEDLRPDFFKYIVLGHFHKRQLLSGYPHVFYTGSPLQHSFNDEGEQKGFYVMDTNKRWDVQFVPIPAPMFFTMNAYDVANEDMKAIADEGHYVRLIVSEGELQSALSYLPGNLHYKTIITKEYKEETRVDVKIGMPFSEIVEKYSLEFNPEALDVGLDILREVEGTR